MTRDELHKLVWEKPMVHVAKNFGMTDVGLRKICLKHNIPTPPVGYWAKLANGKKVKQVPLPPIKPGVVDNIRLRESRIEELPENVNAVRMVALERGTLPENKIVVPSERREKLHHSVAAVEKILRKGKPDQEGFVSCHESGLFDVKIGPASIERVILLVDTFVKVLLARGYSVVEHENGLHFVVDEEPFELRVYETRDKKAHVPTPAELKKQAQYDIDSHRYPSLYTSGKKVWRNWDYSPSGRLSFEISDPTVYRWNSQNVVGRWYDRHNTKVEDVLGDAMVVLVTKSALIKHRRTEAAERARIRADEAARRRREEARLERIEKRREFLFKKADQYARLSTLTAFGNFLRTKVLVNGTGPADRIARALDDFIADKNKQFDRKTLNEEITQLELYAEDDPN